MGLATVNIKNNPAAMDAFTPREGIFTIGVNYANLPHPINDLVPEDAFYAVVSGAGPNGVLVITGLTKGQSYLWTPGANDQALVNSPTDITDANKLGGFQTLTAKGVFQAKGTSVILVSGALQGASVVTAMLQPEGICFQKLWLYPFNQFTNAGVGLTNTGTVYLGKSGNAATKYCPDNLPNNGGPIVYEMPLGQKMDLSQIIISGGHGDGVFYSFT